MLQSAANKSNVPDQKENPPKYKKLFAGAGTATSKANNNDAPQDSEPNRASIPEREFRGDSAEAKRD